MKHRTTLSSALGNPYPQENKILADNAVAASADGLLLSGSLLPHPKPPSQLTASAAPPLPEARGKLVLWHSELAPSQQPSLEVCPSAMKPLQLPLFTLGLTPG